LFLTVSPGEEKGKKQRPLRYYIVGERELFAYFRTWQGKRMGMNFFFQMSGRRPLAKVAEEKKAKGEHSFERIRKDAYQGRKFFWGRRIRFFERA